MPKLSDTQLIIISNAAARDDCAVLPLPDTLKTKGGAAKASLKSLLKKGFIQEECVKADRPAWRDDDAQRYGLAVTKAGLEAIGVASDEHTTKRGEKSNPNKAGSSSEPKPDKPGTKQALLVDLLSKPKGVTIDEMVGSTGWQRHSVRGAISGTIKKRLGLTVVSKEVKGLGRVSRIAANQEAV